MKVNKRTLLLLACGVWSIAGANVLRRGVLAYAQHLSALNLALSACVFLVFQLFIFGKMVKRHTARILGYQEERQYFWRFFDGRTFFIMFIMITGGILLRTSGICPERFIAVFYSGLGSSLLLAGLRFGGAFLRCR